MLRLLLVYLWLYCCSSPISSFFFLLAFGPCYNLWPSKRKKVHLCCQIIYLFYFFHMTLYNTPYIIYSLCFIKWTYKYYCAWIKRKRNNCLTAFRIQSSNLWKKHEFSNFKTYCQILCAKSIGWGENPYIWSNNLI